MVGFILLLIAGIPFYFLLQPPKRRAKSINHLFENKYLLDLQKLGIQETGENH